MAPNGRLAELVDALDSKSGCSNTVRVQVPRCPPILLVVLMKIAIFSDCYLDLTGGIVTNINADKAELEKRGHTVYIFSSAYPRSKKKLEQLAKKHIYPVKSCRIFGRGLTPIARRPKVIEKSLKKTHPELKNFDIFYVHYEAGCSIAGLRLAKEFKIPSVQVMHGREDVGEEKLIPKGLRTFVAASLNLFHSWYIPHTVKIHRDNYLANTIAKAKMWTLMVNHANFADLVLTPSEHFREKLLLYGVKKPVISLHHGISDELLKAEVAPKILKPGQPLEIIWHSRLSGEKRILPFLKALTKVKYPYHLSLYGDGVEAEQAKLYAKAHRLNTTFYGVASQDTIQKALKKSHLDVLVSYNYDTFGMILLEAAASGVPVLIADPALEEILPPNGFVLTKNETPGEIANTINELCEHPENIEKMSKIQISARKTKGMTMKLQKLEKIFKMLLRNQKL